MSYGRDKSIFGIINKTYMNLKKYTLWENYIFIHNLTLFYLIVSKLDTFLAERLFISKFQEHLFMQANIEVFLLLYTPE